MNEFVGIVILLIWKAGNIELISHDDILNIIDSQAQSLLDAGQSVFHECVQNLI